MAPLSTKSESEAPPDLSPQLSLLGSMSQCWQMGPVMTLGPKPNPRLGFQASIFKSLGTPESHPRTWPATQVETELFGASKNPQSGSYLHAPEAALSIDDPSAH